MTFPDKIVVSELRHRRGRTLALLLGIALATTSFTVLTGTSASQRLDVRGTVAKNYRGGYDLLVRAAPCHVESVRRNIVDLVPAEDFAAVGRVFDRVSDHLVNRHPEAEIRQS